MSDERKRSDGPFSPNEFFSADELLSADDMISLVSHTMPYGKYKGQLIADLPGHYLGWFAREGWPAGELGRWLALMYEIDHNGLRGLLEPLRSSKQARFGSLASAGTAARMQKMADAMRAVTGNTDPAKGGGK